MPCCAFAAFIVGQILIGLDALKRFVSRRAASPADFPTNPASEWRLGASAVSEYPSRARLRFGLRWMVVAGSLEIILALGGAYALRSHLPHHGGSAPAEYVICRGPRLSPAR